MGASLLLMANPSSSSSVSVVVVVDVVAAVVVAVRGTNIRGICHLRIFIERLSSNDKNES